MLTSPLETLKKYVDQPSGTLDREDVAAVAALCAEDFSSLGFSTQLIAGNRYGPAMRAVIGQGKKQLMLMGHMDTVFPHDICVPFTDLGDGRAKGSGIMDMKGGIVAMLYGLAKALPHIDLDAVRLCVLLNPDEEIGSPESHSLILETAEASFAALSFEPSGPDRRLTCARKGVTSVLVSCQGIPGHSGARYKECSSAIQALCAQITRLYTLRDDAREISFNAGLISGGTAENVVAGSASCKCEFRYFDESLKPLLTERIREICRDEPVPGTVTTLTFGANHPAVDLNDRSRVLLDCAQRIAEAQGHPMKHERTGGAGDIAIAALAGIGVLDGLGLGGDKMHTVEEYAFLDTLPIQIDLTAELVQAVCKEFA